MFMYPALFYHRIGLFKFLYLTKELIINAAPQGVEIVLLEDKIVELYTEKPDAISAWGPVSWKVKV